MQELGLIGLRIQRMPSEPNLEFGIPSQYSYMTVCFCPLQYYTEIQLEKYIITENNIDSESIHRFDNLFFLLRRFRFVLPHVMIALPYVLGGKKMKEEEVASTKL
jgi:hypothetical protein